MSHCVIDSAITRVEMDGMKFPLGVYPVEAMKVRQGYAVEFESSDGGEEEDDLEEWPDRYAYDVVISAERLEALADSLLALLPQRVYPILDVIGNDAYREIDPYVSYELVGLDRFLDNVRRYKAFLLEDGTCGFGAMSLEPFFYFFLDEHKVISLRVPSEGRERVERVLSAFDLDQVEEPTGADSAEHEHRSVLIQPNGDQSALTPHDIVERLSEDWRLTLNVDVDTNVDDGGHELGITFWYAVVRCANKDQSHTRYAGCLLAATNYAEAAELALQAAAEAAGMDNLETSGLVSADRLTPAQASELLGVDPKADAPFPEAERIYRTQWLE